MNANHAFKDELDGARLLEHARDLESIGERKVAGVEVEAHTLAHEIDEALGELTPLLPIERVLIGLVVDVQQGLLHLHEVDLVGPRVHEHGEAVRVRMRVRAKVDVVRVLESGAASHVPLLGTAAAGTACSAAFALLVEFGHVVRADVDQIALKFPSHTHNEHHHIKIY